MMRKVTGIVGFTLLAATAFAQSAAAPPAPAASAPAANSQATDANPTFVIADVHLSPHRPMPRGGGYPMIRDDRYMLRQTTMRDLVGLAYGVNPGLVRKGPTWLEIKRYDITARMPPGATPDTEKLMLRSLLADRLKLVAHNDTEQMQANMLLPGNGKVKMKQSDGSGDPGCKFVPQPQDQPQATAAYMGFSCHNISMAVFVQNLHNWIYDYFPGPISDATGLKGNWDFDLKWSNRVQLATAGAEGISIYDAIDKQLGLKLGKQLSSVPVVIVDSVNETPTPNAPDIAKILPPPTPEFEVATIKPAKLDEGARLQFNGMQLNAQTPLKLLIYFAWNLNFSDDEALANAPKWLDTDHYDIVAKLATDADGRPPIVDEDDFRRLLRELLADRFQMKTHMEDRPIDSYTMIAVNPKLTKAADPTYHTRCGKTPGPDGNDPRIANPALDQLWYCQNVTMAQTAQMFQEMIAPDYIYNPIQDATGLTGSWDFVLSFSSARLTMGRGMGAPPPEGASAPEPIGAVSFFDAVSKQLGLKLVKQKRPLPVLVIDHIEEKPTEN